jgi:lipid II:glycine glycyltransferase (peptidoglycan interpeptide bridge formation enzyme)
MAAVRRCIVRPGPSPTQNPNPKRQRQLQKLRARLDHEHAALARWQSRLKRAFKAVEKHSKQLARLQRQLTKVEDC